MGGTLLLIVIDGFLHIGNGILQWLGDTRHGLCIRLLQLGGTLLQQLLCHILETCFITLQFLGHLLM